MLSRSSQGCGTILFNQIKHVKQSNIKPCSHCVKINQFKLFHTSVSLNQNKSMNNADEDPPPTASPPPLLKTQGVVPGKGPPPDPPPNAPTPPLLKTQGVVPGKGPPPDPPLDCCMSGCVNCVWIAYAESLKDYYVDGGKSAWEAIEQIENPSLKMFVKLEMGLL